MVAEEIDTIQLHSSSVQFWFSGLIQLPGWLIPESSELASHNPAVVVIIFILCHLAIWLETVSCPLGLDVYTAIWLLVVDGLKWMPCSSGSSMMPSPVAFNIFSVTGVTIKLLDYAAMCLHQPKISQFHCQWPPVSLTMLSMVFDMLSQTMLPTRWQQS